MEKSKLTKFDCDTCGRVRGSKECEKCISNANDIASIPSRWISKVETVIHPPHYQSKTGLEAIDVIEAFCSELNGMEAVCTANVIKYICRWKKKNGVEDLRKADQYLRRLIDYVKSEEVKEYEKKEINNYV